jgi:hypothetical protein
MDCEALVGWLRGRLGLLHSLNHLELEENMLKQQFTMPSRPKCQSICPYHLRHNPCTAVTGKSEKGVDALSLVLISDAEDQIPI